MFRILIALYAFLFQMLSLFGLKTVAELVAAAKSAVLAGNLDEAERLRDQAKALKEIEALEAEANPPQSSAADPAKRLPEPTQPTATTASSSDDFAAKSWFVKRYGDLDAGFEQIARELYGSDVNFVKLSHAKARAFNQYLRHGHDPQNLGRVLLLAPDQIADAFTKGITVGEIKATMIESSGELGGFLVPEDFRNTIISRLPGMTVVRGKARTLPTSRDRMSMIKRRGGDSRYIGNVRATWTDESPTAGSFDTNALYGKVEIPVHTLLLKVPVSRSLLEDSAVPIADVLGEEFTSAMAISEDQAFLTGSGTNQPQGILNGTAANGAPFDPDITLVASGAASSIPSGDPIVRMPYKLDKQYRTEPGTSYMMTKATREAISLLKDGQGIYLFGDRNNPLATAQQDKLRGYDIDESEALPGIAANTFPIVFGNLRRGYTIADRIGMSVERYLDSNTADTDSVVYFVRRRVGGQVTAGWAFTALKVATSV